MFLENFTEYISDPKNKFKHIVEIDLICGKKLNNKTPQEDLYEVVSNINSLKKKSYNRKTPNELFIKTFGKNLLNKLSLRVYESEDVILKKY